MRTESSSEFERDFLSSFDSSPIGLSQVDSASGRLLRANDALCELISRPVGDVRNLTLTDIVAESDRGRARHMLELLRTRRRNECHDAMQLVRSDGSQVDSYITIWSLDDEDATRGSDDNAAADAVDKPQGAPSYAWMTVQRVGEIEDTTARVGSRRKDLFLATLSHELRNPLAPIRNATRIARTPTATPEQLQWSLGVIERQVQHMARLLDDLLDMSRITRGMLELRIERTNIASAVDAAVESVRPLIDNRKHTLTVDMPSSPVWVDGDPVRLAQIFSNLLTNAAKYTDSGGEIVVTVRTEGSCVEISVRDTGIGMSPEVRRELFQPQHVHSTSTRGRAEGGLGLGLALVHGLVKLHHGNIDVHNEGPGHGSEFVVAIPLARPATTDRDSDRMRAFAESSGARRILIADDNRDSVESLAMLLRLQGHEVHVAGDGEEAIRVADRVRPDVALLDIGMPLKDGNEVASWIRAQEWGDQPTLIAVSGWTQPLDRERTTETGFDRHLAKPVALQRLVESIGEVERERRRRPNENDS